MNIESVFELVDCTDEEMYYTLGIFLSLKDAIAAVEGNKEPWTISDQSQYCEICRFEIRERRVGFGQRGSVVWCREWLFDYDDEDDDSYWKEAPPRDTQVEALKS